MPNIAFPILLFSVFVVLLAIAAVTNKWWHRILFAAYIAISIAYLVLLFEYIRITEEYNTSLNYTALYLCTISFAQLLALPIRKRQSGPLVLRLRERSTSATLCLIGAAVFGIMAIAALRPIEYRVIDYTPVFDDNYFRSRISMLLAIVPTTTYFLATGLQRIELHERGLIQENFFWTWDGFASYSWTEPAANASTIQLALRRKPWRKINQTVILTIPIEAKSRIEVLLAQHSLQSAQQFVGSSGDSRQPA